MYFLENKFETSAILDTTGLNKPESFLTERPKPSELPVVETLNCKGDGTPRGVSGLK